MKIIIKNKLVSLGGSSSVTDDQGQDLFKVKGAIPSPTRKKNIYGLDGKKLFTVRNKYWHWPLSYSALIFDGEGKRLARINKKSFSNTYTVKGYPSEILITGNVLGWDFDILSSGRKVGEINRNLTVFKDSFALDVADETMTGFLLALVIAIDNIVDRIKKD